jgi:hypothetical protein
MASIPLIVASFTTIHAAETSLRAGFPQADRAARGLPSRAFAAYPALARRREKE